MSLRDKAYLASLNISQWTGKKQDKEVTREVLHQHRAASDAGRFTKDLLAGSTALRTVNAVIGQARTAHARYTLPWAFQGQRVLLAPVYDEYMAEYQKAKIAFDPAVRTFVYQEYTSAVQNARSYLGSMWNAADYPSAQRMARKFKMDVLVTSVPDNSDFVKLTDDEDNIRRRLQDATTAAVAAASASVFHRLYANLTDPEKGFLVKLANYQGTKEGAFRDSLFDNLRDLTELMPKLNVADDPKLTEMCDRVRAQLLAASPDAVRSSIRLRDTVIRDAAGIIADLARMGYGADVDDDDSN